MGLSFIHGLPCAHAAAVPALNTGQECELLKLEGTIPTFFRGTQYHTPVEVRRTYWYRFS